MVSYGLIVVLNAAAIKWVVLSLGIEGSADFALLLAIATFTHIVLIQPLTYWILRDLQGALEDQKLSELVSVAATRLAPLALLTIVCCILLMLVDRSGILHFQLGFELILLATLYGFVTAMQQIAIGILNISKLEPKAFVVILVAFILQISWMVGLYHFGCRSLVILFMGMICIRTATVFVAIYMGPLAKKALVQSGNQTVKKKFWKEMNRYTGAFCIWGLFSYLGMLGDRWIAAYELTKIDLGLYSVMYMTSYSLVSAISIGIRQAVTPIIFRRVGYGSDTARKNSASTVINIALVILFSIHLVMIIFSYLFADFIITFFASESFTIYADSLYLLFLGASFLNIAQFLTNHGIVERTIWPYIPVKIVYSVSLIGVLLLLPFALNIPTLIHVGLVLNFFYMVGIILINKLRFNRTLISDTK